MKRETRPQNVIQTLFLSKGSLESTVLWISFLLVASFTWTGVFIAMLLLVFDVNAFNVTWAILLILLNIPTYLGYQYWSRKLARINSILRKRDERNRYEKTRVDTLT